MIAHHFHYHAFEQRADGSLYHCHGILKIAERMITPDAYAGVKTAIASVNPVDEKRLVIASLSYVGPSET